jgi:hypothetical protein
MQRRVPERRPTIDVAFTHAAASAGPPHARRAYLAGALAMLVLALLLAAVPTAAQAKGASAASISGGGPGGLPGGPIDLNGDGEPGSGTDLANLAEASGVFALLFEDGPGGAMATPPTGGRGPRYTITWTFPNGAGRADKVRQSVWPYAAGGPLTFLASGQPVLDTTTKGGWYRAGDDLRLTLIALGLPRRQPVPFPTPAPAPATPAQAPAASAPAGAVDSQGRATPGSATLPHRGAEPGAGWLRAAPGAGLLLVVAALAVAAGVLALRRRSGPGTAAR